VRPDLAQQERAVPALSPRTEALDAALGWIETNRRIWAERFDKFDAHLRDIQKLPTQQSPAHHQGAISHD
jgi:hypothetical protein